MPKKALLLLIAAIVLWQCESLFSQDEDVKWTLDPSTQVKVTGQYVDLPQSLYFQNPNTSERVLTTQFGSIVIGPSFRPFPHSATQSEVEVTTQTGNTNIIFASWNS